MKVSFQSRDPDGLQVRVSPLHRIGFVLSRLARLITRALLLSDTKGRPDRRALVFDGPNRPAHRREPANQRLVLRPVTVAAKGTRRA